MAHHGRATRRILGTLLILLLAGCASQFPPVLVITNVTVVNADGPARANQTIVMRGNLIEQVGDANTLPVPRGARVVDARGRYVIPGLWDMHVHTVARGSPTHFVEVLVANGITGVRDMGDDLSALRARRESIAAGNTIGPDILYGGRIDGPGPRPPYALGVATPAEVPAAFDSLQRASVGFVKVPSSLTRELYDAIVREARRRGLPFAGHVPYGVTLDQAVAAGQASIEHEDDVMAACGKEELSIKQRIADAQQSDDPRVIGPVMRAAAAALRAAADPVRCAELARTLARSRTWFTPTLAVYQPHVRGFDSATVNDSSLVYVPTAVRRNWRARLQGRTPEDFAAVRAYHDLALTGAWHRAGVRILAGTDTPLPYLVPGVSLHDELELLTKAGLSPQAALWSATLGPAQFFGIADRHGTIAKGRSATFVLLDADPLADIRNTRKIHAVVLRGRLLDRNDLDNLLARATQRD
jgi:imidazolonepropionase-like amidohydrolase